MLASRPILLYDSSTCLLFHIQYFFSVWIIDNIFITFYFYFILLIHWMPDKAMQKNDSHQRDVGMPSCFIS